MVRREGQAKRSWWVTIFAVVAVLALVALIIPPEAREDFGVIVSYLWELLG